MRREGKKRDKEIITVLRPSQVGFRSVRGFTGASFVNSSNAEFIMRALHEIGHSSTIYVTLDLCAFLPGRTIFVSFLYDVTSNR